MIIFNWVINMLLFGFGSMAFACALFIMALVVYAIKDLLKR